MGYSGAGFGMLNPAGYAAGGGDAISSLDELGDWFAYGLPGGVTGTTTATGWTDGSPHGRNLLEVHGAPVRDTTTLPNGKSILEVDTTSALGLLMSGPDSTLFGKYHYSTFFCAILVDTLTDNRMPFSATNTFTTRYAGFVTNDETPDVGFEVNANRVNAVAGDNLYTSLTNYSPDTWMTIFGVCNGAADDTSPPAETMELYLNGDIVSITKNLSTVDGKWIDSIDISPIRLAVGGKFRDAGSVSHMFDGMIGAWGWMGGSTSDGGTGDPEQPEAALNAADVKLAHNFIAGELV